VGLDDSARGAAVKQSIQRWHREHAGEPLFGEAAYEKPPGIVWDDQTYRGDAYGAFAWAAYVAEVEVDLRTCTTRVIDFVAVQEVGKVLNPTLAKGQVQGGVVQGIGWALMEECKWRDGAMANNQLTNYLIPTSHDVPPVRVAFLENPYPHGAGGAKGLGELPIDGPAPAILNAVARATGADPRTIPLTPERLMDLMESAECGVRNAGMTGSVRSGNSKPADDDLTVTFTLNGKPVSLEVDPAARLLDTLRYQLTLTGTKRVAARASAGPAPCTWTACR